MWASWVYDTLRSVGTKVIHDVFGWECRGVEHLPMTGPAIVAANHVSYLDPPLIGSVMRRRIHFMAKEEVFAIPLLGSFLHAIGSFPLCRRKAVDVTAVRHALRILERGDVLGIFPEGTRNRNHDFREMLRFYDGVGWLALRAQAPVIPVAIDGYVPTRAHSRWTRPTKLRIVCGRPIWFDQETFPASKKPYRTAATKEVRAAIRTLLMLDAHATDVASEAPRWQAERLTQRQAQRHTQRS